MRVEITDRNETYEINLQQITQLLGINMKKKQFILDSLDKFFSGARYSSYEENMQDNVRIERQKVGRKYFSSHRIHTRENLIKDIKISKTSMMMQYLLARFTDFECRLEQDAIAEHLERLYLCVNEELAKTIGNIEISYDTKNMLEVLSESMVCGVDGKGIEQLSNYELLETYLDLFVQLQKREPQKMLILIENIDHLLDYEEYEKIYLKMQQIVDEYDCWFVVSASIHGFIVLNTESIEGIQVINDTVFSFPSYEHIFTFLKEEYPIEREWSEIEVLGGLKDTIQYVGKENCSIDFKGNVFLKLINQTLDIKTVASNTVNSIEMAFLMDADVV